jgi:bifunctional DNA-binding transcriptional regulator/antitoxin component of YhaV-PrlF toxin-antitoxin module
MSAGSIQRFRSVIENAGGGGAFVSIPFDVERVFGKKRVPVEATIDAESYRGTLVRMGGPSHILPVLKEIRQKIGKGPGDAVDVVVEEDLKPRVVVVPRDLMKALKGRPRALLFFRALSYTSQKEHARWIEDAKRPETRSSRVAKATALLAQGKRAR